MQMRAAVVYASLGLLVWEGCHRASKPKPKPRRPRRVEDPKRAKPVQAPTSGTARPGRPDWPKTKAERLAAWAMEQVGRTTKYDPSYVKLAYPGGDVPMDRGVCTDVVVRALRRAGVDLQVLIHEDMRGSFGSYPKLWGLKRPDANIDHRRVPNIATFLRRAGKAVPVTKNAGDYRPGDIVVWRFRDGRPHMGIVSVRRVPGTGRYHVVHNIGAGTQVQDCLFAFEITGHFRYF